MLINYPLTTGGHTPFTSDEMTKAGQLDFPENNWSDVSDEARDLIGNLLKVNPSRRFTVQQALQHNWITNPPDKVVRTNVINNFDVKKVSSSKWRKIIVSKLFPILK